MPTPIRCSRLAAHHVAPGRLPVTGPVTDRDPWDCTAVYVYITIRSWYITDRIGIVAEGCAGWSSGNVQVKRQDSRRGRTKHGALFPNLARCDDKYR